MERINILMAADDNYAQHLGVTLISALENTKNPELFDITVLDGGISDTTKKLLTGAVEKYGAHIDVKKVELKNPEKYVVYGHISIAAYYRILLPEVYPPDTKKIIYLDCDVIVNHDLMDMTKVDLQGKIIGAVPEVHNGRMADTGQPDKPYFNSGILLIDFQKWIENNTTETVLEFIFNNPDKLVYWDQDALNFCLIDKWFPLDIEWNYMREYVLKNKNWKNAKKYIPHIVHYSNKTKPWHYYSKNPYDYLYFKYLAKSPWKDFEPEGKTIKRVLAKKVKLTLRKLNLMHGM